MHKEKPEYVFVKNWLNAADDYRFDLSFSVKVKYDAHIFVCNTKYPPKSQCYWILLGFQEGKFSGLRNCGKNLIDETTGYPFGTCSYVSCKVSKTSISLLCCMRSAFTSTEGQRKA